MSIGASAMRDLLMTRSLATGRGTSLPSSFLATCSALNWTFAISTSTRNDEDNRRECNHVDRTHEQRRVPDVSQQAEIVRDTAQRDQDKPRRHHHYRDRCDIEPDQIDLGKAH